MKRVLLTEWSASWRKVERGTGGKLRVRLGDAGTSTRMPLPSARRHFSILIGGSAFEARVLPGKDGLLVRCAGREFAVQLHDPRVWRGARGGVLEAAGSQQVLAPMPGKVVRILAAARKTSQWVRV